MVVGQGDVQPRQEHRQQHARHANQPKERAVLPAGKGVVRGMQQVKQAHRQHQRAGGIVRQQHQLAVHQTGRRPVGSLGLQKLGQQGRGPVLDQLLQFADALHRGGVETLEPRLEPLNDFRARHAVQVDQRKPAGHRRAHAQRFGDQVGRGQVAPQQRDIGAQALHKALLGPQHHGFVGGLVYAPGGIAPGFQHQRGVRILHQHRRHARDHRAQDLRHPVLGVALGDLHHPGHQVLRGEALHPRGQVRRAGAQYEIRDLLVGGHALDVDHAQPRVAGHEFPEVGVCVDAFVEYGLEAMEVLIQIVAQHAPDQVRMGLVHGFTAFSVSGLVQCFHDCGSIYVMAGRETLSVWKREQGTGNREQEVPALLRGSDHSCSLSDFPFIVTQKNPERIGDERLRVSSPPACFRAAWRSASAGISGVR